MTFPAHVIEATRRHFHDLSLLCMAEAAEGIFRVNEPDEYYATCWRLAGEHLSGKWDHTLTFRQYAHYLQTGQCVALLP